MGKGERRRNVAAPSQTVWQTARVRVDDETWAEWRHVLGERSVAEALGAYVELEVARARKRRASRSEISEREAVEVLERIEATQATLEKLVNRLEGRLPLRRD
ncbi:hypothetical protein [Conexibacter sp. SYSU D00693]|uniref:hypothetical protein n=1 Tax=Conexibacter sp. SYSU D00693 TaxID=2812560 RepID=UPI00196AEBD5|nr:hypothetical protein [Conexibacter sp. SYSU D00693]